MSREVHQEAAPGQVRVGVLIISDTRTPQTDVSGQYLQAELRAGGHSVSAYRIVRDDALEIRGALTAMMAGAQVILSSGGTGITGRDVTIPVVEGLITKPMPGFGELFRMLSYREVGGAAMLSRAVGGLAGHTLIFALPGSLNAVQTAWTGLLRDELGHLVYEMTRHGNPAPAAPHDAIDVALPGDDAVLDTGERPAQEKRAEDAVNELQVVPPVL